MQPIICVNETCYRTFGEPAVCWLFLFAEYFMKCGTDIFIQSLSNIHKLTRYFGNLVVSADIITNATEKGTYGKLSSVNLELRGVLSRSVARTCELGFKPTPSTKRKESVL